jgi:hypothetical protein
VAAPQRLRSVVADTPRVWCKAVIESGNALPPEWRLYEVLQPMIFHAQRVELRQRLLLCCSVSPQHSIYSTFGLAPRLQDWGAVM